MKTRPFIAIIPARGGSKGIARKNIRDFLGKPLIAWAIEAAQNSGVFQDIIVSTEDKEIETVALRYGAHTPYPRPSRLAGDDSSTIDVIIDLILNLNLQCHIVLLQPTSPLRSSSDIQESTDLYSSNGTGSLVSICKSKSHPFWTFSLEQNNKIRSFFTEIELPTRRQEMEQAYSLNGAIYISNSDLILRNRSFIHAETYGFEMPRERSVDIDDEMDWKLAEFFGGALKCDAFL